jgi:hypothetical protein
MLNKTAAQVAVQRVCFYAYQGLDQRQAVHALGSAVATQRRDVRRAPSNKACET